MVDEKGMLEDPVGRVVICERGGRAGKRGVVVAVYGSWGWLVTGPPELNGNERRPASLRHLALTDHRVDIAADASDAQVLAALERAGLSEFMKERKKPPPRPIRPARPRKPEAVERLWAEAAKACGLAPETVEMARTLDLDPQALVGNLKPKPGERLLTTPNDWIRDLYVRRFGPPNR
ncbi:MAG: hypothetical protein HYZ28_19205 [Myxococcales bacterium]|nr:hypothetical protein [Myxococcales bacterium]